MVRALFSSALLAAAALQAAAEVTVTSTITQLGSCFCTNSSYSLTSTVTGECHCPTATTETFTAQVTCAGPAEAEAAVTQAPRALSSYGEGTTTVTTHYFKTCTIDCEVTTTTVPATCACPSEKVVSTTVTPPCTGITTTAPTTPTITPTTLVTKPQTY